MSSDYDTTNVNKAKPLTLTQRLGILEESVKRLQWYVAQNGLAIKHDYDHAMWKELNVKDVKKQQEAEDHAITLIAVLAGVWCLFAAATYFFITGG
jgi:hypothetical protein